MITSVRVLSQTSQIVFGNNAPNVIVGLGGLQGAPGLPGQVGVSSYVASANLSALRAVILTPTGLDYADASLAGHADKVVGITTQAGLAGALILVRSEGEVEDSSWAWVAGEPVWLGFSGLLTQDLPVAPGLNACLGYAVTSTKMYVQISDSIYLN